MDSLTHILVGATIGETVLGKKIGNKALFLGAAISTIPDLDVLISPLLNPVNALFFHRGISHSLLIALIFIILISWILFKKVKYSTTNFNDWIILTSTTFFVHLLIDCLNTYGTGLLEPFTNLRVSYDSVAIIDFFVTLPLLVFVLSILFFRKENRKRRILAWASISLLAAYFSLAIFNKSNIESFAKNQLIDQKIKFNRILTTPIPLSNLMWMVVADSDEGYYIGYFCNSDSEKSIQFRFLSRNNEFLKNYSQSKEVRDIIRFTKGYYTVDSTSNGGIEIHDLRFGSLDFEDQTAYVFTFELVQSKDGVEIIRSRPKRKINFKTTRELIKRII